MRLPAELYIALRYMRPRRNVFSITAFLSIAGVVIGVWAAILMLSVMSGFSKELERKFIGYYAHIVVDNGHIIHQPDEFAEMIAADPEVEAVTPYVQGRVVSRYHNERQNQSRLSTPVLRGIPEDTDSAAFKLADKIRYGEFDLSGNGILVGRSWASRNHVMIGDRVLIMGPRHMPGMSGPMPVKADELPEGEEAPPRGEAMRRVTMPDEFVITGIFATGLHDLDNEAFISSLFNVQRVYDLQGGVHCISVLVKDPDIINIQKTAQRLRERLGPGINVNTWMDLNPDLFEAIAMERIIMAIIMFLIITVAGFGLATTIITITVQKSREIGVLKATGAQDGQIMLIFSLHGLIVGVIGSLIGFAMGLLTVAFRNVVRDWIGAWTGIDVFPATVYKFPEIPAVIQWDTNFLIILSVIAVCVLAALVPAYFASRLDPVRALRYE